MEGVLPTGWVFSDEFVSFDWLCGKCPKEERDGWVGWG